MKLKTLFLLFLLLNSITYKLCAETIEGTWYTPLRNKLLSITISKDSITARKCSFDNPQKEYGNIEMAFKIEKKIKSTYIVSALVDSVTTYYLFGFESDKKSGRNYMNIESMNSDFLTIADAEKAIPEYEKQPLKIIFLSTQEVEKIKAQKDIATMTTTDFKTFATKIIKSDSTNAKYIKRKYKFSYLYTESLVRIFLSDAGFNSFVKGNVFDDMIEKFANDPETKDLFVKMAGSGK